MCIGFVGLVKTGQDLTRPGARDDLGEILKHQREAEESRVRENARKRAEEAKAKGDRR